MYKELVPTSLAILSNDNFVKISNLAVNEVFITDYPYQC